MSFCSPASTDQLFGFPVFQLEHTELPCFNFSTSFSLFSVSQLSSPLLVHSKPHFLLNVKWGLTLWLLFWGGGRREKRFPEGDSIFHTVGKICTMEIFYAALTNSQLKTWPVGYVYLPSCINIKGFCCWRIINALIQFLYILFVVVQYNIYILSLMSLFLALLLVWVNQFRRCQPQLLQTQIDCSHLYSSCPACGDNKYEFFFFLKSEKRERPPSSGETPVWGSWGLWSPGTQICGWTLCSSMVLHPNS